MAHDWRRISQYYSSRLDQIGTPFSIINIKLFQIKIEETTVNYRFKFNGFKFIEPLILTVITILLSITIIGLPWASLLWWRYIIDNVEVQEISAK